MRHKERLGLGSAGRRRASAAAFSPPQTDCWLPPHTKHSSTLKHIPLQKLTGSFISASTKYKTMWCMFSAKFVPIFSFSLYFTIAKLSNFSLFFAMLSSGSDSNMSSSKSSKYCLWKNDLVLALCVRTAAVFDGGGDHYPGSSHSLPSAAVVTQSDCSLWLNSSWWTTLYSYSI